MLSKRRNKAAATKFFARASEVNGLPRKIVIDKSGANTAGITAINRMLKLFGGPIAKEMMRIKCLENSVRIIKKRIRPMLGFKPFVAASVTLEGILTAAGRGRSVDRIQPTSLQPIEPFHFISGQGDAMRFGLGARLEPALRGQASALTEDPVEQDFGPRQRITRSAVSEPRGVKGEDQVAMPGQKMRAAHHVERFGAGQITDHYPGKEFDHG